MTRVAAVALAALTLLMLYTTRATPEPDGQSMAGTEAHTTPDTSPIAGSEATSPPRPAAG